MSEKEIKQKPKKEIKQELEEEPKQESEHKPKQGHEQQPKHEPKEEPNAEEANVFNFENWSNLIDTVITDSKDQNEKDLLGKLKVHFKKIENENFELKAQLEEEKNKTFNLENEIAANRGDVNNDTVAVEFGQANAGADNENPTIKETQKLKHESDDFLNVLLEAVDTIKTLSDKAEEISKELSVAKTISNAERDRRVDAEYERNFQALDHEKEVEYLTQIAANLETQIQRYHQLANRIQNEGRQFNSFIMFYAENAQFFWSIAPRLRYYGRGAGAKAAGYYWRRMTDQQRANYRVVSIQLMIRQLDNVNNH